MTLEEALKRYKKHSECIQQTLITKEEAMSVYEMLRELKAYKKVRRILSQNRIATDRYGDVVLWDDIKRVLKEVNADDKR